MINIFYKDYTEKLIAMFLPLDSTSHQTQTNGQVNNQTRAKKRQKLTCQVYLAR